MTDLADYHFCETPRIRTRVPGPRSRALLDRQREIEASIVSYPRAMPIAIKRAKGASIEDVDGNLFLDFFAGAGVLNLGHCNPDILSHAFAQGNDLVHALDFPTEVKLEVIEKILGSLPLTHRHEFKVAFVGPTGAEAVEAAVKLAKMATGRDTVIAFSGGYHGMSSGTAGLSSAVRFRKVGVSTPNVHFAPFPYCYRCPVARRPETCALECFALLREMIENSHSGVELPAAILIEPVQGEGGSIPVREVYLDALVGLARKHGILVIFDEVQAGFFRTGEFLSFMHGTQVPDVIAVSKGLGGVGFPLAGLIYRRSIEAWQTGDHIGTFRGNQVGLAACSSAFDFVAKHGIQAHVEEIGAYLMAELVRRTEGSPYVGEIRGKGLMIGIEFVRDRTTRAPYPELVRAIRTRCLQAGLLFEVGGHHANVIRLIPPLIITRTMVDCAVTILGDALREPDWSSEPAPAPERGS